MSDKKTLYLHIGQDKAGSTAIQSFLYENYDYLKSRGYEIVGGHQRHHGHIHRSFKHGDRQPLHQAGQYIRNSDYSCFAMSFEGFYHLHQDEARLKDFLSEFSNMRIVVVFYVRRRSDKYRSGVAQRIKRIKPDSYKHANMIIHQDYSLVDPSNSPAMDYLSIVRKWQKSLYEVGLENVFKLRVYERSSLIAGDLITDFARTIGLFKKGQMATTEPLKMLSDNYNPSLSPAAQYLMLLSQVFDLDKAQSKDFRNLLIACDDPSARKNSLIPDNLMKALDKKFLASDKELAKEFYGRSKLFIESEKFHHQKPDDESFIKLISELLKTRKLFK